MNTPVNPTTEQPTSTDRPFTTIGVPLGGSRLYTYKCYQPIAVGDTVSVKLPKGAIVRALVQEVHDKPQLSDKWEIKWAVKVDPIAPPLNSEDAPL